MCKCAACQLCSDSPATEELRASSRRAIIAPPKTSQPQPQPQPQPAATKPQLAAPSSSSSAPAEAEPTHPKKGGADVPRKEHDARGAPGAPGALGGGGGNGGGGKGKGVGTPVVWQPGRCADWCDTSSADDCELGGCIACTWCAAQAQAPAGSSKATGAAGGAAKPAGSPATVAAAPTGMGTGAPPKQVLSYPMLMPFPLWHGGAGRATALGALSATLVGLCVFALLALVSLRRHERPLYGALLEHLPPKLASRVDLVASLGRGGGGYRAAVRGDDGDDDDGAQAAEASWEPPPLGGGGGYPAVPDVSAAEVRFAAATTALDRTRP